MILNILLVNEQYSQLKKIIKREVSKPFIFNSPRDRYTLDLFKLPYFINVIDNKK